MRNEGTAMKQSGLMLLVITWYKPTDLSKVHVSVMVSNINTGLVKDAFHNVQEIIIMQMRQEQESVNEAWRKAEMETLLNPETTEEWRHDIWTVHKTWQHEHTTIYTENNKHHQSMTTNKHNKPWHMAADPPDPNSTPPPPLGGASWRLQHWDRIPPMKVSYQVLVYDKPGWLGKS